MLCGLAGAQYPMRWHRLLAPLQWARRAQGARCAPFAADSRAGRMRRTAFMSLVWRPLRRAWLARPITFDQRSSSLSISSLLLLRSVHHRRPSSRRRPSKSSSPAVRPVPRLPPCLPRPRWRPSPSLPLQASHRRLFTATQSSVFSLRHLDRGLPLLAPNGVLESVPVAPRDHGKRQEFQKLQQ